MNYISFVTRNELLKRAFVMRNDLWISSSCFCSKQLGWKTLSNTKLSYFITEYMALSVVLYSKNINHTVKKKQLQNFNKWLLFMICLMNHQLHYFMSDTRRKKVTHLKEFSWDIITKSIMKKITRVPTKIWPAPPPFQ